MNRPSSAQCVRGTFRCLSTDFVPVNDQSHFGPEESGCGKPTRYFRALVFSERGVKVDPWGDRSSEVGVLIHCDHGSMMRFKTPVIHLPDGDRPAAMGSLNDTTLEDVDFVDNITPGLDDDRSATEVATMVLIEDSVHLCRADRVFTDVGV